MHYNNNLVLDRCGYTFIEFWHLFFIPFTPPLIYFVIIKTETVFLFCKVCCFYSDANKRRKLRISHLVIKKMHYLYFIYTLRLTNFPFSQPLSTKASGSLKKSICIASTVELPRARLTRNMAARSYNIIYGFVKMT